MARAKTYEVHTCRDARWSIDQVFENEAKARAKVDMIVAMKRHEAVRLIEISGFSGKENIALEQKIDLPGAKPVSIAVIEHAPVCQELGDFYAFPARKTLGRALRAYLNKENATPLEFLYNFTSLRRLEMDDRLLGQLIQRVAGVQARIHGGESKDRVDILYRMVPQIKDRAREFKDLTKLSNALRDKGLMGYLDGLEKDVTPEYRNKMIGATLAGYIGISREWDGKLELALNLADFPLEGESVVLVDELVAEILDCAEAVRKLLGDQPDLGSALYQLSLLATGTKTSAAANSNRARLNTLMANYPMVETRAVLMERVQMGLLTVTPLTKASPMADNGIFSTILLALCAPGGMHGGATTCDAVTRRARIALGDDLANLSPDDAIEGVMALLPNRAVQLGYLLDLAKSEYCTKYQDSVMNGLASLLKQVTNMASLFNEGTPRDDATTAVTDLKTRLDLAAMPESMRMQLAKRLAALLRGEPADMEIPDARKAAAHAPPPGKLPRNVIQPGTTIFMEGDSGDAAYLISSGRVEIVRQTESGGETVLSVMGRGAMFGEMALIDNGPRSATARALDETTLVVIPYDVFRARLANLAEFDRVMRHLIDVFVVRLRATLDMK